MVKNCLHKKITLFFSDGGSGVHVAGGEHSGIVINKDGGQVLMRNAAFSSHVMIWLEMNSGIVNKWWRRE